MERVKKLYLTLGVTKMEIALVSIVLIAMLSIIALGVTFVGGQPLGERVIVGRVANVRLAPATMPQKLGVTMTDGTYLILDDTEALVDTYSIYNVRVKETRFWWGTYSDILEFSPIRTIQ